MSNLSDDLIVASTRLMRNVGARANYNKPCDTLCVGCNDKWKGIGPFYLGVLRSSDTFELNVQGLRNLLIRIASK